MPRSAVLDTGTRKLVYVAKADGVFEAREIQTGHRGGSLSGAGGIESRRAGRNQRQLPYRFPNSADRGMTGLFGGSKEYSNREKTAEGQRQKLRN